MPPNQDQEHTADPIHPPSQPVVTPQQPSSQPSNGLPGGGMKVIQPTGNVTAPESTLAPQVVVGGQTVVSSGTESITPNFSTPPVQPNSIYPTPQSSTPVTKDSVERELRQKRRRKMLTIVSSCLVGIILLGAGGFYFWHNKQATLYNKLTTATYNQNGYNISFSYPAVMTTPASQPNNGILLAYAHPVNNSQRAVVGIGGPIPYGKALQHFGITPSQVITQLVTHKGSFVDILDPSNPNAFNNQFGNCHSYIKANSGQTDVLCVDTSQPDFTVAKVIGEDDTNQYSLFITVPNSLWAAHQQVWQKVEKSFSY